MQTSNMILGGLVLVALAIILLAEWRKSRAKK